MYTRIQDAETAADALYFERELLTVLPTIYEQKRPLASARSILPLTVSQDPDASVIVATSLSWTGDAVAGEVGWKNGADTPVVAPNRVEQLYPVRSYKLAEQWRERDLRVARQRGLNIETRGVQHIFDLLRLKENNLIWNGDATQPGIFGVTTNPNIGTTALPSSDEWDGAATTAEMYNDLVFMGNFIAQNSSFTQIAPVTILLPWTAYNIIASRRMDSGTDTTVLQYFMNNRPAWVDTVLPVRELNTSKRAVAMIRDNTLSTNYLVQDVMGYNPIVYSGGYSVDYELRTAGFIVFDSTSIQLFSQILN